MGCLTLKVTKVVPDEKSTPVESEQRKKGGCKLQDGGKVLEGQKEHVCLSTYTCFCLPRIRHPILG